MLTEWSNFGVICNAIASDQYAYHLNSRRTFWLINTRLFARFSCRHSRQYLKIPIDTCSSERKYLLTNYITAHSRSCVQMCTQHLCFQSENRNLRDSLQSTVLSRLNIIAKIYFIFECIEQMRANHV